MMDGGNTSVSFSRMIKLSDIPPNIEQFCGIVYQKKLVISRCLRYDVRNHNKDWCNSHNWREKYMKEYLNKTRKKTMKK